MIMIIRISRFITLNQTLNQTNHVRGDRDLSSSQNRSSQTSGYILDSEITLVPSKFVSTNQMIPTDQTLQAANGSEITVLGEAELKIKVRGCTMNLIRSYKCSMRPDIYFTTLTSCITCILRRLHEAGAPPGLKRWEGPSCSELILLC